MFGEAQTDALIRAAVFGLILLTMLLWESLDPRRTSTGPIGRRLTNIGIGALNVALIRVLFPFLGLAVAVGAQQQGWGVLSVTMVPGWLSFFVAILFLDLVIYFQHRLFHAFPLLWRLHRMHHADTIFDTTTGVRFHPLEAIFSMAIKSLAIVLIGAPPLAYLVFEIILNGTSLFNHGNVKLPPGIDRWLRWLMVTPDMHRVHHSVTPAEHNRNFGFNLPWWDRLFRTYQDQPVAGHLDMTLGLDCFRETDEQRLDRLLSQPFRPVDRP